MRHVVSTFKAASAKTVTTTERNATLEKGVEGCEALETVRRKLLKPLIILCTAGLFV